MRLFVIDNYDSFTYNIVQYFGELGAEQEVVRNDAIGIDDLKLDGFDGLVVSPGPCDPDKAGSVSKPSNAGQGKSLFWASALDTSQSDRHLAEKLSVPIN